MEGGIVVAEKWRCFCISKLESWSAGEGVFAPYLALPYFLECLIVFFAAIGCRLCQLLIFNRRMSLLVVIVCNWL
jgi:hypothetical protein